jgi:hypothetical protein
VYSLTTTATNCVPYIWALNDHLHSSQITSSFQKQPIRVQFENMQILGVEAISYFKGVKFIPLLPKFFLDLCTFFSLYYLLQFHQIRHKERSFFKDRRIALNELKGICTITKHD